MTRMTGPDCAVMCNLINIHTYTHTYLYSRQKVGAGVRTSGKVIYYLLQCEKSRDKKKRTTTETLNTNNSITR